MTEQISTNAEGVQKPKRTYNRKPKQIVVEAPTVEHIRQPLTLDPPSNIPEPLPEKVPQKPKRTYKKKVRSSPTYDGGVIEFIPTIEEPIPEPPVLFRQTNKPHKEEVSSSDETNVEHCVSSQPSGTGKGDALLNPSYVGGTPLEEPREKKPRTEKQQEAFRKMREARLKKQEELSQLKAFDKEQKLMKKEHDKLNKLKEKLIYEKCTPPLVESHCGTHTASQNFVNSSVVCGGTHKVSNIPNYIFV